MTASSPCRSRYRPAYETISEGGWIGLLAAPEYGGMGLPDTVGTVVNEFFSGSNVSLSLTLMLTRGAGAMIENFGTDELKAMFIEKIYSGQWGGTMCLTESQAGSDVGPPDDQGRQEGRRLATRYSARRSSSPPVTTIWRKTSSISCSPGRPGAPVGTKGLSLFVVPKIRVNDGRLTG